MVPATCDDSDSSLYTEHTVHGQVVTRQELTNLSLYFRVYSPSLSPSSNIATVCLNAAISSSRLPRSSSSSALSLRSCAARAGSAASSRSSLSSILAAWGGRGGVGAEVGGVSTVPDGEMGSTRGGGEKGGMTSGASEESGSPGGQPPREAAAGSPWRDGAPPSVTLLCGLRPCESIAARPSRVACSACAQGCTAGGTLDESRAARDRADGHGGGDGSSPHETVRTCACA